MAGRKSLVIGAVCAAIGAAVSGGVVAFAANGNDVTFYACAAGDVVQPGTIRIDRPPSCGPSRVLVSWNQGDPGPAGLGAIVSTITGQPSSVEEPPVYYDAVVDLEPGTWQVEGSSTAGDCLPLAAGPGATIEQQYFPASSALSPEALVTVADGGTGQITMSCHGQELPGEFTTQLLAIPVSVHASP